MKEKIAKLARRVVQEVEAVEAATSEIMQRWERNTRLYNLDPSLVLNPKPEAVTTYAMPIMRQKTNRMVGSVFSALTNSVTYVQVSNDSVELDVKKSIQADLTMLAKEGNFESALYTTLIHSALTNCGVIRTTPQIVKIGEDEFFQGFTFDVIRADQLICYPNKVFSLEEAKTVGHKFQLPIWIIEQRQAEGIYDADVTVLASGADEDDNNLGPMKKTHDTDAVEINDGMVELYSVITRSNHEGKWDRYQMTIVAETAQVLRCEPWEYEYINYHNFRLTRSESDVIGDDCFGNLLQGLNMAHQDLVALAVAGAMITAFPPLAIIGGSLDSKTKQYGPAEIFEFENGGVEFVSIPITFNGQVIPMLLEKIEEMADAVSGISRVSSSQSVPGSTKATTINALTESDRQRMDQYVSIAAEGFVSLFRFLLNCYEVDYDLILNRYRDMLMVQDRDELIHDFLIEVSGKSVAGNADVMLQSMQMVLQLAQNPSANINMQAAVEAMLQVMPLPVDWKTLQNDPNQAIPPDALMQPDQGVPAVA
jgi:hypothetical protein